MLILAGAVGAPDARAEAPSTSQGPASAEQFVDSVGYNGHFENHYSLYAREFPRVKQLLADAGIRHVRVGMLFKDQHFIGMMQQLSADDIHVDYVTQENMTQEQLTSYPQLVSPSLEMYEAPNEPDKVSDPNWAAECRTFQEHLYSWLKSDPQTRQYPVIGPSVTGKFAELGDVSSYLDYANIHNYLDVYNPDTNGWGRNTPFGTYGSIQFNMNLVKQTSANKPVISTETGYGATPDGGMTVTGRPTLDFRAQMRYIPRLFFEQFNHGIVRTYGYEFIDKGGQGTFDNFGIIQTDLTPKPAYTALKSIMTALKDPGPAFTTTPLQIELSGNTQNVQYTLLEKHNGTYVLAIWLEVLSWKPHGGGAIIVPDQQVQVGLGQHFSHATLSSMDERGMFATRALPLSGMQAAIPVSDKVSLVTLSP
jgi:hypothetical protein